MQGSQKEAPIDDGTKATLQNDDPTPEQQMFCIYYSRTFNAAQSYQKAYGCSYESAIANGSRLLTNDKVRAEIERLKEIKRQQIVAMQMILWNCRCVLLLQILKLCLVRAERSN